jgi:hypothetical protein
MKTRAFFLIFGGLFVASLIMVVSIAKKASPRSESDTMHFSNPIDTAKSVVSNFIHKIETLGTPSYYYSTSTPKPGSASATPKSTTNSDLTVTINGKTVYPASPTPIPTSIPTMSCKTLTISIPEFASSKCYTTSDYNELSGYISKYNNAVSDRDFIEHKYNIVCNGSDFFKDECEETKIELEENRIAIEGYGSAIKAVMNRGK